MAEPVGFIIGILPLLQQIQSSIDEAETLPEACKSLQNDVNFFIRVLESHNSKLKTPTSPSWLPSLETALAEALDIIQVCASKPFKAKLLAFHYSPKLTDARDNIRDALEKMAFHGFLSIEEQRISIQQLNQNVQEIGDNIVNEVSDTQTLVQEVTKALKNNQEEILQKIAKQHGLEDVHELQKEILEYQREIKQMKENKQDVEEQLVDTAKRMSKLAIEFYATCPPDFKCPITRDIMECPMMLVNSGHTYERSAILEALKYNANVDPLTNAEFVETFQLQENYTLKKAINDWVEKQQSIIMNSPSDDSKLDPKTPAIQSVDKTSVKPSKAANPNISSPDKNSDDSSHHIIDMGKPVGPNPAPIPNENNVSINKPAIKNENQFYGLTKGKRVALFLFVLVVIIVTIVAIVVGTRSTPTSPPTPNPTSNPSRNPTSQPSFNTLFSVSKNISPPIDGSFSTAIVDISDSNIVIGNYKADNEKGELYVYNIDGLYLRTIRAPDGNEGDGFAFSLSIHNNLMVVGSPLRIRGKVYIYDISGVLMAELTPPDSMDNDMFGHSVGISETHVVIGASRNGLGKAYIYTLNPLDDPIEIRPNDLDSNGRFAERLSVSGNRIVFGASTQDHFRGVAYLYSTTGQQISKLKASDGQDFDWFGLDVAIDGDIIAVGAPWDDDRRGAIYLYNFSGNEIRKVTDPDGKEWGRFGLHVYALHHYIAVRAVNNVFICDTLGNILTKRDVVGLGDVALTDEKLVVHVNDNIIEIMHNQMN